MVYWASCLFLLGNAHLAFLYNWWSNRRALLLKKSSKLYFSSNLDVQLIDLQRGPQFLCGTGGEFSFPDRRGDWQVLIQVISKDSNDPSKSGVI